jgi:hypothetical protein
VAPPPIAHWKRYIAGEAFLRALGDRKSPKAVWNALPGEDWPARLAEAAAATAAAGRGAVLVVPDQHDLDRLDAALTALLGEGRHATLSAQLGPTPRYRSFLRAARGEVRIVGRRPVVRRTFALRLVHVTAIGKLHLQGMDQYIPTYILPWLLTGIHHCSRTWFLLD